MESGQHRIHLDVSDVKAILGSGFLWAWFDALFMSAFHLSVSSDTLLMAEGSAMAMDGLSIGLFTVLLLREETAVCLLQSRTAVLLLASAGTIGSFLFMCSGVVGGGAGWALVVIGGVLGGSFAAAFQVSWGALYCRGGAGSALTCVSGAFACAVVLDLPLLFMAPVARACFFALFPFVSGIIWLCIPTVDRCYPTSKTVSFTQPAGLRARLHSFLGLSGMIAGGLALAMLGFGYMQHLVSFSSPASGLAWGVVVQVARGIISTLVFVGALFAPRAMGTVYRVGLLVMVGGFMANAIFLGTDYLWVSGVILICGYTVFDIMVWVVISQVAYTQSGSPAKTIALTRMLAAACYVLGALAGIVLAGSSDSPSPYMVQKSNVVGYLVVIAVVFLMSSEDIWALFNAYRFQRGLRADQGVEATEVCLSRTCVLESLGLTPRELEVAELLALGRTQPWIAETLGISGNTVGTHTRHIYQKAGVHDRQEFIDLVLAEPGGDADMTVSNIS